MTTPPVAVDQIITRHPADEAMPDAALGVGTDWTPFSPRLTSAATTTWTLSYADFLREMNAEGLRIKIYGKELFYVPLQMNMLRRTADRWSHPEVR